MREMNLTEGSILKQLIKFSLPMMVGNLLQQVYNLVDTLIVGKCLGADALAAVGSVYTLMIFLTSIIIGLCMGSGAFFSADYGAKDEEQLKEDIWHSFWFIFFVSIVISIIVYPCMDVILKLLQTPQEILYLTKEYVFIIFSGIIFIFFYNFFAYLLRAMGNSLIPLIFLGISSFLNIVLDLLFVSQFQWGVGGAAIATVIAQIFSGIGIAVYALHKIPFLRNKRVKWNKQRMKTIIINDISTGIQQSVMNFGILMIQGLVNSFGTIVMASFAAAVKIDTIAYMPAQEFGNAYSLFVSQNFGANKTNRIKKGTRVALASSALFCMIVSIFIVIFSKELMCLFIDYSEIEIISEGVRYLRIEGAGYVGIGILFIWYGYFRGINQPHFSLILTILSLGTRVVLSYTFAHHSPLGVLVIWLSIPIGWIFADIIGCIFYKKIKN